MTEEKQELNEDLQAPEGQEELNSTEDVEDLQAPEGQEDEDDYKTELEKVKKERDNYKEGLLKTKDKLKEAKASGQEDDTVQTVLDEISTNDNERELIKHHYDRLQKTGSSKEDIAKDLEDAKLLANSKKIYKENKELQRSLISKQSVSNSGAGSSVKKEYKPEPKLNPKEASVMNRVNAGRVSRGEEPLKASDFLGN